MRAIISASLLLASLAAPVLADETTGTILAYDRVDNVLVLTDKTVWELPSGLALPEDLKAGDTVRVMFDSAGENGVGVITSVARP